MTQVRRKVGVVVHTDAAFDYQSNKGAWGAILECGILHDKAYGIFPDAVVDNHSAELLAAEQGINMALKRPVDSILLYTDSRYVVTALDNRTVPPKRQADAKILHEILAKLDARQISFTVRHIRAHTDKQTKPAIRNRWCDAAARTAMAESAL